MLAPGAARKVSIHLNEDTADNRDFLVREIFAFLFSHGVAGATLTRPQAGFGSHHRMHATSGDAVTRTHLPVLIEFVEAIEKVDALMSELCDLVTDGLIEAHETTVIKAVAQRDPV